MAELDDEQGIAVDSNESMIVIAGPGSGKTRVLTEKGRHLLEQGKNVVCLCFTRSAAKEMGSRVLGLPATTIHSYCYQTIGWAVPEGTPNKDDGYAYLLKRFHWIMKDCMPRFDWVLLDECQDINPEELDVVLSMVGDKIFAVGDPFQSIYGFQRAMGMRVVSKLERLGCKPYDLKNNYRSCPEIVNRLNTIYKRNLVSKNIKENNLTSVLFRKNEDLFMASGELGQEKIPHTIRLSSDYSLNGSKEKVVIGDSNTRLMTIHSSKGLEFDNVILYNWFPSDRDEELRVYYVAMSRASKRFTEVSNLSELKKELTK